ncbi:ATP-binding cassette sub-family A member 3 [Geodia barretti]|uniref:ATP-binding cassette sub-family A member 3 n=1 Tax=Geodia barretti TaxID=519541 RepID=A0AA35R9R6_GEOBA|nr:ATP-binding cassette sub-family A member 3 [Geodia barretti]CAI8007470.1 ATP-binding cassette sub-family A member 3 [Geodia barretti]
MLDKFCASRTVEELDVTCSHINSFPYHHCRHCLSCCESRVTRLPSCTHPLTQPTTYEESQFCPSSPQISLQDLLSNSTSGPLDTHIPYVDELLMRLSHAITAPVFTRRVVGGFVVQRRRDPPYSVCGCSNTQTVCRSFFNSLHECGGDSSRPVYVVPSLIQTGVCPALKSSDRLNSWNGGNRSGVGDSGDVWSGDGVMEGGCEAVEFPHHYEVDGLSADLLQRAGECGCGNVTGGGCECGDCEGGRMVSAHYYQDSEETLSVTVWYNNRPWHMSAAALNAFHNVWLRQATNNSNLRLTINNHPLPRTNLERLTDVQQVNLDGYYVGTTVVFGYSFLVASFVLVLVAERENKAKHLQFVSGATVTSFWLAHLSWDLLNSLLPLSLSVAIFAAAHVEPYSGIALLAIACLLILTCWSSIPIVYSASFLFKNSLVAFGVILVSFFVSCLIFFLITLVISDELIKDTLHYVFLLNPAYTLGIGLNDIYINHFLKEICNFTPLARQSCASNDVRYVDNLFSLDRPGIGILFIYMSVEGLVFFILTLFIEWHFFTREISKLCQTRQSHRKMSFSVTNSLFEMKALEKDSDVEKEARRVAMGQVDNNSAVIIKNLVKVYPRSLDGFKMRPAKTAVEGISVAIPTGECFGLLGVNGAGKTTTFNILIGDTAPTSGTAIISGYNIRTDPRKVRQLIGYCPQFDALIERMTGRELLTMFARLRGIPESLISQAVEAEVARLDLSKHASKQCGKYSGGNKRKLSTAIALIGDPPIILLDEPTTGMDPGTRRYLWDVLTGVTREGRSIILTSHSMEECEALCTRLAIMVNGQFKCLGSIQHLKNRYGSGYLLQAKVRRKLSHSSKEKLTPEKADVLSNSPRISLRRASSSYVHLVPITTNNSDFDTSPLHNFINDTFPGAHLLEEHQGAVTYQLRNEDLRWATVFREIEEHRDSLGIEDYSVSQTTLEQVSLLGAT